MKRTRLLVLCLLGWPAPASADYYIDCESKDYRYSYCAADTRAGVELDERKSSADCTIGESWGYDAGGVWVDNGCRARFHIFAGRGVAPPAPDQAIEGLIAPDVLGPLQEDDADDGLEPGYGRADAVRACARAADGAERNRGASNVLVESVEQVMPRGRRAFDLRFTLRLETARGVRSAPATCSVAEGSVTSYGRY